MNIFSASAATPKLIRINIFALQNTYTDTTVYRANKNSLYIHHKK